MKEEKHFWILNSNSISLIFFSIQKILFCCQNVYISQHAYDIKPECSTIEKMFSIQSAISLFTVKIKTNLSEHPLRMLIS